MSSSTSEEESIEFLRPYFTNLKLVGIGGSGAVYSAIDVKTDKRVALKRANLLDQLSCKGALRQISVYKRLQHENIVSLEKVVGPDGQTLDSSTNFKEFQYVFLVQELVDADLHRILQSNKTMSEDYIKLFIYQLLRGLKYVHSANVIHRDIKPSNILVDTETLLLKIGDFGLTRVVDPDYEHKGFLTHCPSTLWYRAPELILEPDSYSNAMDIWGVGCVFAELLLGKPLFEGRHEIEQVQMILDTVGTDDKEFFKINSDAPEELLKSITEGPNSSLASKLPDLDAKALDLLEKMLKFSPKNRITAEEALAHPYLQSYSLPSDEPISLQPLNIEDEVDDFPEDILKDMLYSECVSWQNSDEPKLKDSISETEDSSEHDILSLKDIMNDNEEPVIVDHIISGSACEMNISSFKLHPELSESFGVQNTKEARDTLAAAMKVSMTLDEDTSNRADTDEAKNFKSQQKAGITQVVETFLGREYQMNLGFSCKKTNAITGPFGLCYL
ncbi:mitogen-activated protein kinase 4-like [Actinia tenebrosa]|uniref:Mitogen-activated protein kinase 4-like n=1 Tax=Actinia tenebrosa TaxID=6105 RepID=A0A6P8HFI9_ACTTE|nr:mitogen-activated protein kinase 4-like [Actinia tenebrosa]